MDCKSLRHPLRWLHKLRTPLGKKLRASNLRIWQNTTLPSTTAQETSESTQKCIWLGKVSETGENYVATKQGVLKARTVRRLQPDFKNDLALLNKVSGTPWAPKGSIYNPSFATLLDTQIQQKQPTQDAGQQTNIADDIVAEPATKQQRTTSPPRLPSTSTSTSRPLPDSPMATSPTGRQHPPLPAPPDGFSVGKCHCVNFLS